MALATLSIDLEARLANLQQGMDKAGRLAEKQSQQIQASFSGMKTAAAGVGAALAASLSAAGILSIVRATIDGVDRLNDLADATGASIENLSALEDIAARTGTSMDTVGDAVVKLNKFLGEAGKPGTDAANALKLLGLNAAELKKQDPAEALRQVAVALAGTTNDGNKARIIYELFGKSIREVAPLLNDLAKAGQLNATVTTEQAKQAEKFNQQLAQLSKNATDVARDISGPLVSSLNDFFAAIARMNKNKGGFFAGFGEQLNVDFLRGRMQAVKEEMERLAPDADRARGILARQPDSIRAKATLAEFAQLQKAAEDYRTEIDAIVFAGASRRPANEGGGGLRSRQLGDLPVGGAPKVTVPKGFISNSFDQDTINALKALESTDTNKLRDLQSALSGLFELQRETRGDPAVVQAIAKVRADIDALTTKKVPDAEPLKAYQDALAAIGGTNAVQIRETSAALDELFKMREMQLFGPELDEAIEQLRAKLQGLKEPLSSLSEFAKQAARNIQDALGDSIVQTMEGSTKGIEDVWKNMLKRLVAQAAAAKLASYLLGDNFSKTGQIGGAAGTFIDFLQGLGGGARAGGGPVYAGRPYLVGEKGPEIVVPRGNGTVLPNGQGMAGSSGPQYVVNVQGDASENTLRLINGALAQFEARNMSGRR